MEKIKLGDRVLQHVEVGEMLSDPEEVFVQCCGIWIPVRNCRVTICPCGKAYSLAAHSGYNEASDTYWFNFEVVEFEGIDYC